MATARNGTPARRLRLDRRPEGDDSGHLLSGKRFVLAAGLVLALTWGGLSLVFRDWRARHRELAAYGREHVAAAVEPLADTPPPGVGAVEWRAAVDSTRRMLADVTASGLLDRPGLDDLRLDLEGRVATARARPATALAVLSGLWDDMGRKTRLRTDLVPRPKLLGGPGTSPSPGGSG